MNCETIGDARLYQADALTVLESLPDGCADCIITDPPYNVGYGYDGYSDSMGDYDYLCWQLSVCQEAARVLREGGHFLYLHYPEFAARMFHSLPEVCPAMLPYELLAWTYHAHTSGSPLRKAFRLWCWWTKGPPVYIGEEALAGTYRNQDDRRVRSLIDRGRAPRDYDWWHYEQVKNVSEEKTAHPCQLPVQMVSRLVRLCCPPCGTVLDPFAGSGTTGESALKSGRWFVGVEQSAAYVEVIRSRLRAVAAQEAMAL